MKWISRFFTLGMLGAALVVPFLLKMPNGKPIMEVPSVSDFIPDKIIPDSLMSSNDAGSSIPKANKSEQTFYKWKDEQGVWHYGDQPPPNAQVSTLQVDTNANIIQSFKIEPEEEEVPEQQAIQNKLPERLGNGEMTMDNAMNIMDDAKAVRDMMEARNAQLKAISGE